MAKKVSNEQYWGDIPHFGNHVQYRTQAERDAERLQERIDNLHDELEEIREEESDVSN